MVELTKYLPAPKIIGKRGRPATKIVGEQEEAEGGRKTDGNGGGEQHEWFSTVI